MFNNAESLNNYYQLTLKNIALTTSIVLQVYHIQDFILN